MNENAQLMQANEAVVEAALAARLKFLAGSRHTGYRHRREAGRG